MLLAAALLAQRGFFRLPVVIAVAVAADSSPIRVYFQLSARLRGRAWLDPMVRGAPALPAAHRARGSEGRPPPPPRQPLRLRLPHRHPGRVRAGAWSWPSPCSTSWPASSWALPMAALGFFAGGARTAARGRAALRGGDRPPARGRPRGVSGHPARAAGGPVARAGSGPTCTRGGAVRRRPDWRLEPALGHLARVAVMMQLEQWSLLEVTQRSRALMLLAGLALLQVTRNLGRRKALAWWVVVAGMVGVAPLPRGAWLRPAPLPRRRPAPRLPDRLPSALHRSDRPGLAAEGAPRPRAGGDGLGLRGGGPRHPSGPVRLGRRQHPGGGSRRGSVPILDPVSTPSPSTPRASWALQIAVGPDGSTPSCSCCDP